MKELQPSVSQEPHAEAELRRETLREIEQGIERARELRERCIENIALLDSCFPSLEGQAGAEDEVLNGLASEERAEVLHDVLMDPRTEKLEQARNAQRASIHESAVLERELSELKAKLLS